MATRLQVDKAKGYKAKRLQGYKDTRLQGYKSTRLKATRLQGNKEDELLLRDLIKEDNSSSSSESQTIRQKLLDLEKLIISPNDDIRHKA